jgi:hypothetical protein
MMEPRRGGPCGRPTIRVKLAQCYFLGDHVLGDHVFTDHVLGDHVFTDHVLGDHKGRPYAFTCTDFTALPDGSFIF